MRKTKAYKIGAVFIALNDGPGDPGAYNPEDVAGYVTTVMLSEMFDLPAAEIAQDIVDIRHAEWSKRESKVL